MARAAAPPCFGPARRRRVRPPAPRISSTPSAAGTRRRPPNCTPGGRNTAGRVFSRYLEGGHGAGAREDRAVEGKIGMVVGRDPRLRRNRIIFCVRRMNDGDCRRVCLAVETYPRCRRDIRCVWTCAARPPSCPCADQGQRRAVVVVVVELSPAHGAVLVRVDKSTFCLFVPDAVPPSDAVAAPLPPRRRHRASSR